MALKWTKTLCAENAQPRHYAHDGNGTHFQGYPGVHHNQSMAAPTGVTVEIVYPSRVSYVAVAEDTTALPRLAYGN